MRKFSVSRSQDGKHVVKAAQEVFPALESKELFHALKRKDIRINGKRIASDVAVKADDEVEIWLRMSFSGDSPAEKKPVQSPRTA